jgi:predicted DCC family thiol-disulfide oxidoreductase YuxK
MKRLNVIYDAACPLCQRCRAWLQQQYAIIELAFTPMQASDLDIRFPGIVQYQPHKQLLVVSDEGGVYVGAAGWIMCLYALEDYRELALRLANPRLMPLARRFCELISNNRLSLSHALHLASREVTADELPYHEADERPCLRDCKI